MFDVALLTKLIDALESLQCTESHLKKVDAFQRKGLRTIAGIPPTHIDREWTNERALKNNKRRSWHRHECSPRNAEHQKNIYDCSQQGINIITTHK